MDNNRFKNNAGAIQRLFQKIDPDEAKLLFNVIYQDPFISFYRKSFFVFSIVLLIVLLWPFHFSFVGKKNHVTWSETSSGLNFSGEGQVIAASSSRQFCEQLMNGKGLTLEMWVQPKNNDQRGPARIVSYSLNANYRNFTIGQYKSDLIVRLRTENTNLNGTEPMLRVEDVFSGDKPLHIVVRYNYKVQSVYVNGVVKATSVIPGGDFTNWDPGHLFVLGNEVTGDRPWLGKIAYVAIYTHPIEPHEVLKHYEKVKQYVSGNFEKVLPEKGLLVRYLFNENDGKKVANSGTLGEVMRLNIPEKIQNRGRQFLSLSFHSYFEWGSGSIYEMLLNVLLFIPFGFLLFGATSCYMKDSVQNLVFVMVVGLAVSFCAEILQYFSEIRHSSSIDLFANGVGTLLGIQLQRGYTACLRRNIDLLWKVYKERIPSTPT